MLTEKKNKYYRRFLLCVYILPAFAVIFCERVVGIALINLVNETGQTFTEIWKGE